LDKYSTNFHPLEPMKDQKILIIDDEKELCSLLKEYFSEEGYVVEVSYDGEGGISKVESFEPDVIILDHRMPNIGGFEVIKKVRETRSIPIICVSAVTSQEVVEECLRLGATKYIFKPINLEGLSQSIKSVLKKN
jgi:DNA-binding response OmpR family regulator